MKTSYYLLAIIYSLSCLLNQRAVAQIFHEDFENMDSVTVTAQGTYLFVSTSQVQTSGSFSAQINVGDSSSIELTTIPVNTIGLSEVALSFNQICRIDFFDAATVEVSNDGGLTFIKLTCNELLPGNEDSAAFCGQGETFSSATTLDWDPGLPNSVATNADWHSAYFDLSMFLPADSLIVRFKLEDRSNSGTGPYPGWYIDDIMLHQNYFLLSNANNFNLDLCTVPYTQTIHVNGTAMGYAAADSVATHVYFGDGTDSTLNIPITGNLFNADINHLYSAPGNYSINITVTSPDNTTQSYTFSISVGVNSNCGSIAGSIYTDINGNCIFDSSETGIRYVKVDLYNNNVYVQSQYSNYAGKYIFYNIPNNGNYTLKIDTASLVGEIVSCPSSGFYTVTTVPSINLDFGLTCNAGLNLFTQTWVHSGIVAGAVGSCTAITSNFSCTPVPNAITKLVLPPQTTYLLASVPPQTFSGDTIIWNTPITARNYFLSTVWFTVDSSTAINDTLCFTTIAEPISGDIDPTNNISTVCSVSGAPFDPNNKTVMPEGNILPGQMLSYRVNFQNTGTAPAQNVYVLDTLDANLDLSSLNFTSASHNVRFYVLQGNVLKAEFPNIMLPDSNTNEPMSHGFFSYTIHAKNSLVNGAHISNTANIYFDYNPPIVTNTTENIIQFTVGTNELTNGGETIIYPNPFTNEFTLTSTKTMEAVYLRSITGELLFTKNINDKTAKINVQQLPGGVYVLSATSAGETRLYKVVKL